MNCKFVFETEMEAAEFPEHFRLDHRTWPCSNGCGGMRNEHLSQLQKCVHLPGLAKKEGQAPDFMLVCLDDGLG